MNVTISIIVSTFIPLTLVSLNVIEAIREKGLEKVVKKHSLKCKQSKVHPELVCLHYNQIHANFQRRIDRECRGIILNRDDDWAVVSLPYMKFFNYGERFAHQIDWGSGVRIYEKLDGSILTMYYYNRQWHVQTSSIPDASGMIPGNNVWFWCVW